MRNILRLTTWVLFAATVVFATGCSTDNITATSPDAQLYQSGDLVPNQYIVVYKSLSLGSKLEDLQSMTHQGRLDRVVEQNGLVLDRHGISREAVINTFGSVILGSVMTLSKQQLGELRKDPSIRYIEQDRYVSLPPISVLGKGGKGGGGGTAPAQETPWGITCVGGFVDKTGTTTGVWIVDTGVDFDHPDLNVDIIRSRTFVPRTGSADDEHGHGTHVSGTIAAINNDFGVVGVAAGATVISMRVLDRRGSGQFSWSVSAFGHVWANGTAGDVVNYSVGPGNRYESAVLDAAVKNLSDKGIRVCIAAGNATDDCAFYSPARVDAANVYTISAMDAAGVFAYFSNYGAPVDYCEPGVGVLSCYKGGGYATMSGTSMASPHAAGILTAAGAITANGIVAADPDGNADPIGVR
ncbi:MAG: S8 family serine peptidase [Ignavibacteria bacterium]|nr:S8 family serine peptidase [Ignavibacteria bacterium]